MSLSIKSVLEIRTLTHETGLTIPLKQGEYNYCVGDEDLCILSKKEPIDFDTVSWSFVGDEGYYSLGSDLNMLSIQDRKSNTDDMIDVEALMDTIDNFLIVSDCAVFMTPSGNGGGAYVYTAKNEKGHIIAVRLCGIEPDFIDESIFKLR